jgi:hypothetical protein
MTLKYNHIYGINIEKTLSHYDIVFTKINSVETDSGIQGGLHCSHGQTLITIIRHSSFVFDLNTKQYPGYIAEKLRITYEEAKFILNKFEIKY